MGKTLFFPDQFIDDIELNRLVDLISIYGFRKLLFLLTEKFGISRRIRSNGINSWEDFKITATSSNKIGLKAGYAFTSAGELIVNENNIVDIATLSNGIWYAYIEYAQTTIEKGTISIDLNGNVTGNGTEFTKIFSPGKKLQILNSTLGNNGSFEVISVGSDTTMVVEEANIVSIESGLIFSSKANFTPNISPTTELWDYRDHFALTLSTQSNLESDIKFKLAKIVVTDNVITNIIDLRTKVWKLGQNVNIPTGEEKITPDLVIEKGVLFVADDSLKVSILDEKLIINSGVAFGKNKRVKVNSNILDAIIYSDDYTNLSSLSDGTYYVYITFKAWEDENKESIRVIINADEPGNYLIDDDIHLLASFNKLNSEYTVIDRRTEFTPYLYSRKPLPIRKPLDLRLVQISPLINDKTMMPLEQAEKISDYTISKPADSVALVTYQWGYDNLIGTGNLNQFTLTNLSVELEEDEWVGYGIWIPNTNKSYLIIANTETIITIPNVFTTTLTLVEIKDRTDPILTGISATSNSPAIIHSFADSYIYDIIPVKDDGVNPISVNDFQTKKKDSGRIELSESPVSQYLVKQLKIGMKYKLKVQAIYKNEKSEIAETPIGIDGDLIILPPIVDDGVLTLVGNDYGIVASVSGWATATHIEFVYTVDGTEPSFTSINPSQYKISPTASRVISIPLTKTTNVKIACRGLQCGYQVTTIKTGSVTGGAGGIVPLGDKIVDMDFKLYAYTGKVKSINQTGLGGNDVDNSIYDIKYKNLKVFGRNWDANIQNKGINNHILKIGGAIYRVLDHVNTDTISHEGEIRIERISGSNTLAVDQDITINDDIVYGRIITEIQKMVVGYQLTKIIGKINFNVGLSPSTPGKIRVGQKGNMQNASIVSVIGSGDFEGDASAIIKAGENLIVDFVDTSGTPNNSWSAEGHITVFGLKKVTKINTKENIKVVTDPASGNIFGSD